MAAKNENHALLLGAYKDIAKVLTENGITFFGMYGTALGAVRHKGIIPWDDDIDIAVFGKDLDKVNEATTNCGTREKKLDLIKNRLMSQKTNFETLESENENVEITDVALQLKGAELTYQAALMSTSKILQTSLMHYI